MRSTVLLRSWSCLSKTDLFPSGFLLIVQFAVGLRTLQPERLRTLIINGATSPVLSSVFSAFRLRVVYLIDGDH
jgi:hypothetical protein